MSEGCGRGKWLGQYPAGEGDGRLHRRLRAKRRADTSTARFPVAPGGPGFEGIYNTKWLRRIKVVDRYYMTYNDYGHISKDPEVLRWRSSGDRNR